MAPGIALEESPRVQQKAARAGEAGAEAMRRKNRELEMELRASREREEAMRRELERMTRRLRVAEEAEERICSQLGDLEAESAEQARLYYLQIRALTEQLALRSSGASVAMAFAGQRQ